MKLKKQRRNEQNAAQSDQPAGKRCQGLNERGCRRFGISVMNVNVVSDRRTLKVESLVKLLNLHILLRATGAEPPSQQRGGRTHARADPDKQKQPADPS